MGLVLLSHLYLPDWIIYSRGNLLVCRGLMNISNHIVSYSK